MRIYLGLGTNLGDKELNLRVAVQKIEERIGKVISLSAFYATAPWGFQSDNNFLNAAAEWRRLCLLSIYLKGPNR